MPIDVLQADLFSSESNTIKPAEPRTAARHMQDQDTTLLDKPLPKELMDALKAYVAPSEDVIAEIDEPEEAEAHAEKSATAMKTISEVAAILDVPQHVLRFWESRFPQIKPVKSRGGRRYYRPEDMKILTEIKHLLYQEGYTIKGAKKALPGLKRQEKPEALRVSTDLPLTPMKLPEAGTLKLSERQKLAIGALKEELLDLREVLKERLELAL